MRHRDDVAVTAVEVGRPRPAANPGCDETATGWAGLRRLEFSADDPMRAREFLARTYGWRLLVTGARDLLPALPMTRVDTGYFAVSDVTLPADLKFEVTGRDALVVSTIIEGTAQADRAGSTDCYGPGDIFISNSPQAAYVCYTHSLRVHNSAVPVSLLNAVAAVGTTPSVPVQFLSSHPASPAGRTQWRNACDYVDSLLAESEAASPLMFSVAARLLAATALTVFPNTATNCPSARDRHPRLTLHRATAFIDANAGRDISVADIAAAADVTVRAVQLAFRHHLDTTPLTYLRRVRLALAHQELAANRSSASVTAVAYRWGFSSASRFAAAYRLAYGVAPSDTLRAVRARAPAPGRGR
jgi:AraC-like DNA-binding protein